MVIAVPLDRGIREITRAAKTLTAGLNNSGAFRAHEKKNTAKKQKTRQKLTLAAVLRTNLSLS